ncbi:MAG TPA: hypothetical protein PKW61_00085 [Tenuifilaceae bacterium]|nr:hypothetical protein [Tenuifilaceae bacterium]
MNNFPTLETFKDMNLVKIHNAFKAKQGWTPIRRTFSDTLIASLINQGFTKVCIYVRRTQHSNPMYANFDIQELIVAESLPKQKKTKKSKV